MTACTNHGGKARRVVTAALVGVLSVGTVPMAALATGADAIQTLTDDATDSELWNASTFEWSIEADAYGAYKVDPGDVFAIESVTDVYGNTVSAGDYVVVYFDSTGSAVDGIDAVDGQPGGMPKSAGSYTAAVVKVDTGAPNMTDAYALSYLESHYNVHKQGFSVEASASKTLEGAFAFNGDGTDEKAVSDTTFNFNGGKVDFAFADADGNVLDAGDYDIAWLTDAPNSTQTNAGTYTALLTGKNEYAGSTANVSFTVNAIDLSTAVISIDAATSLEFEGTNNAFSTLNNDVYVNGEKIEPGVLDLTCISYTDETGKVHSNILPNSLTGTVTDHGTYTLKVSGCEPQVEAGNVSGDVTTTTAYIVAKTADVEYDETDVATYFTNRVYETSKGEGFDPELLVATVDGDEVPLRATVTKDGVEVTSYDEPGEYVLTLEVPVPANCAYGYKGTFKFTVLNREIDANKVMVYASIDGKAVDNSGLPYTGDAYVPSVVVKEGKKVLTAGTDYTVSYRVKGEKDAIDSMVEPGDYEIVVSFPGSGVKDYTIDFKIVKATIKSAETATPVYAYTGEAVKPDFVGYTGASLNGTAVELPNDGVGVVYYEAVTNNNGTPSDASDDYLVPDTSHTISASNLKAEGTYFAKVTVNSNNEHYTGTVTTTTPFQISEKAAFDDVDASAWYAGVVYEAKQLGLVHGMSGTNMFAPEADISRADAVCILFNLAGGDNAMGDYQYNESTGWVTGFNDVDGKAYYAKALAWAHNAGVANGSNGSFRPNDKITREELACMLANYATVTGDYVASDGSALAALPDASSVSAWAEANVAWAVENGIMGNGGFVNAGANITRAEVAAMAVNYTEMF